MNCLRPGPRRHCHDEAEPRAPRGRARGVGLGPAVRFFRPHEPPATHASGTRDQPNFARPPPSRGGSLLRGGLPSPLHLSLPVTVFQGVSVGPGLIGLPSFSFRKCCTMRIPKAFFCLASRRVVSFVSNSSFFSSSAHWGSGDTRSRLSVPTALRLVSRIPIRRSSAPNHVPRAGLGRNAPSGRTVWSCRPLTPAFGEPGAHARSASDSLWHRVKMNPTAGPVFSSGT